MEQQPTANTPNTESQPQPPNPPTPPQQQVSQKKKSKTWIVVLLITILLVGLGVAGILLYQSGQIEKLLNPTSKPQQTPSGPSPSPLATPEVPLPSPTVSPSPNGEMVGWLSYSKDSTCYTFKHPEEVTLKEQNDVIHLSLWGPTQKEETEFYDGISLSFSLPLELGNTSLKDYVDSAIEESKQHGQILKPRESITVNGISGYTYTSEGLGIFQHIYLQSPSKSCTVDITNATKDPTNQGFEKTVDQILSTFEFTK